MTATHRDPRIRTEADVRELARRGQRAPGSLSPAEIRAVALYVLSRVSADGKEPDA